MGSWWKRRLGLDKNSNVVRASQYFNSDDEVILLDNSGGEVDRVEYDASFPDPTGASMALVNPSAENNDGTNWTVSTTIYGAGDMGTPGESNSGIAVRTSTPLPAQFELHHNYPNPFNAVTVIPFNAGQSGDVRISVHDLHGREVVVLVAGRMVSGSHKVTWDGSGYPSGLYFCKLDAGEGSVTRKLLLLK